MFVKPVSYKCLLISFNILIYFFFRNDKESIEGNAHCRVWWLEPLLAHNLLNTPLMLLALSKYLIDTHKKFDKSRKNSINWSALKTWPIFKREFRLNPVDSLSLPSARSWFPIVWMPESSRFGSGALLKLSLFGQALITRLEILPTYYNWRKHF